MRITFCHKTANLSGGNKVVAQYADRLAQRGHHVVVVTGPDAAPSLRQKLRGVVREGAPLTSLTTRTRHGASHLDGLPRVEHRRVPEARPFDDRDFPEADVVVATWWETSEWVAKLSRSKGAKAYFVQGHESTIEGMPSERVERTLDLPLHKITIARFLVDHLARVHGERDVSYVPNAVDGSVFDAPPREKQGAPTVGCIYTGSALIKGFDVTHAALHELKLRVPSLEVVCFGTKPPPPGMLPSHWRFELAPSASRIPALYASMDVFAHGSRVEGFGLPILEAMACRTPVVATPTGAAPELLAEERGLVVPTADPTSMARALFEVLSLTPTGWRSLSERAHAFAHRYSLDDATTRMERALEHAVATQR